MSYSGVLGSLGKGLTKERITIYTDSQSAITALTAKKAKTLFVSDCMEKLIQLSKKNHVTIVWTFVAIMVLSKMKLQIGW